MMVGKKYYHLTAEDIEAFPLWALSIDVTDPDASDWDDDPALVVPQDPGAMLPDRVYYARATFISRGQRTFKGYIKAAGCTGVDWVHPTIVVRTGYVSFYYGIQQPSETDVREKYELLGTSREDLFPLAYRADVLVHDIWYEGVLNGFYYRDLHPEVVRFVT